MFAAIPGVESKDVIQGLADRPMSKEQTNFRIRLTLSCSSAKLEDREVEQIASRLAKVEDAVVQLSPFARQVAEAGQDTNVVAVIRTVVNGSVAKAF